MTHRRLLVVVLLFTVFFFGFTEPTDMDFWWHLMTGRLIVETWTIPTTDPFSFTALGRDWVVHEWLWDVLIHALYVRGGYVLAAVFSALVVTLAYAVLYHLLRRLGINEIASVVLVAGGVVLALPNIGVRPREFTHLFMAVYVNRLFLFREGQIRYLWWLPPLMVLWVNLHGAFVLGIALLALFTAVDTWRWLMSRAAAPRHLWLVGAATVLATAVNPHGPRILLYPFGYFLRAENPSLRIVTEFQSPDFHDPVYWVFAVAMVALMLLGARRERRDAGEGLVSAAFVLQGLLSVRQVSVAYLVLAPVLAMRLRERFLLVRERPPVRLPRQFIVLNWFVLALLVVSAAAFLTRPQAAAKLQVGLEPKVGDMPEAGARFIEENGLPGPVFNYQPWGGYLIYRWYPRRLVFIDGRIDMFGPKIVEEYQHVITIKSDWSEILDGYGIQTVLIPKQSALSILLVARGDWNLVFRGDKEDVFTRSKS